MKNFYFLTLSLSALLFTSVSCGAKKPPKVSSRARALSGVAESKAPTSQAAKQGASLDSTVEDTGQDKDEDADDVGGEFTLDKVIQGAGEEIQVKSLQLLLSSVGSCFGGPGGDIVSPGMIYTPDVGPGAATADGKVRIIVSGSKAGVDKVYGSFDPKSVVVRLSENFYDIEARGRANVASDQLTDSYLRSLRVVADVFAWNCDVSSGGSCDCSTPAAAKTMFERCLPQINSSEEKTALVLRKFSDMCASTSLMERRKAIAAMVGSYAFATSR